MKRSSLRGIAGALAALALAAACGGGSNPTVVPTPTPTPTPRVTFTLDAPADHYQFSQILGRLTAGQSFEVTARLLRINEAERSEFGHAVEVWLLLPTSTADNYPDNSMAFSAVWVEGSDWVVYTYTPEAEWSQDGPALRMGVGEEKTLRVTRHADGTAEFFVNGVSMRRLSDSAFSRSVVVRVVGTGTEFSYVPQAVAGQVAAAPAADGRCAGGCRPLASRVPR